MNQVAPLNAPPLWLTLLFAPLLLASCASQAGPGPAFSESEPLPRADFPELAAKLARRCAGGPWISEWRQRNPDDLRPTVALSSFHDQTGRSDIDGPYLQSVLQNRLELSGVYDMVEESPDFLARGFLARSDAPASGRSGRAASGPMYTASLEIRDAGSQTLARRCTATVQGELR